MENQTKTIKVFVEAKASMARDNYAGFTNYLPIAQKNSTTKLYLLAVVLLLDGNKISCSKTYSMFRAVAINNVMIFDNDAMGIF